MKAINQDSGRSSYSSSERSESRSLNARPLLNIIIALAFLGIIDASYLTAEHYLGKVPECSILSSNCGAVLTSEYSVVFGIPLSLLGLFYYLVVFCFAFYINKSVIARSEATKQSSLVILSETKNLFRLLLLLTLVGFLFSLGLVYIQAVILHAYCLYCLVSAGISTLLFVVTFSSFRRIQ